MRFLLILGAVFLLICFSWASHGSSKPNSSISPSADDLAIYSFMLAQVAHKGRQLIIMRRQTIPWRELRSDLFDRINESSRLASHIPKQKVIQEMGGMRLLDRINGVMDKSETLTSIRSTHQIQFVDGKAVDAIFQVGSVQQIDEGWQQFYQKYPGAFGYAEVSTPVYSQNHKQALVYASFSRSGLDHMSLYQLLEKKKGRWIGAGWGFATV